MAMMSSICLNGHIAESYYYPPKREKFCATCGAATITKCPRCRTIIPGLSSDSLWVLTDECKAPNFCTTCGSLYPWTESALKAAHELANEISGISEEERDILNQSLDELVKDTPQAEVATIKFKKIMSKAGPQAARLFEKVLIAIITEAAKKEIFGQ